MIPPTVLQNLPDINLHIGTHKIIRKRVVLTGYKSLPLLTSAIIYNLVTACSDREIFYAFVRQDETIDAEVFLVAVLGIGLEACFFVLFCQEGFFLDQLAEFAVLNRAFLLCVEAWHCVVYVRTE